MADVKYSPKQTMAAITMPPTKMKNTPATFSICSEDVSSVEALVMSGQFVLSHHLREIDR